MMLYAKARAPGKVQILLIFEEQFLSGWSSSGKCGLLSEKFLPSFVAAQT